MKAKLIIPCCAALLLFSAALTAQDPLEAADLKQALPLTGQAEVFVRPLAKGSQGEDVALLQKVLNTAGFTVAKPPQAGSPGRETLYFGNLTASAVQSFQCEKGIVCEGNPRSTGFGLVGPKTRSLLNSLFSTLKDFFSSVPTRAQLAQLSGAGSGLVAHYTFDEGTGATAGDSSGNGNTGTLVNGPTWVTGADAKVGSGALSFDGVNDYVNAGTGAK